MKLLSDRILVLQDDAEETTKSGIIITDHSQWKPNKGTVLFVGTGMEIRTKEEDGSDSVITEKLIVEVGDRVYFSPHSGVEVITDSEIANNVGNPELEGKPLVWLRQLDIWAILNK